MDFFQINTREIETGSKKGQVEIYPDFVVGRSNDLMVRGRAFYAIYDEGAGLWSTDEYDVQRLVDHELAQYAASQNYKAHVKFMRSFGTQGWTQFRKFMANISDNAHQLDESLTFANTEVKKTDYVSRRLPYRLEPGDTSAWDELIGTLYAPEEREKIEWAIGSVISGDSKKIQKFLVLYGPAGTGKSTVLNIIQKLFDGYTTSFEAKALGSNGNAFATEAFKNNPLVAIQHDGDLSKIEDNTKINSIVSHEWMTFNEKYKPSYTARANAMLWMGTNQPVKISDAKSGIIRRLIDVHPTGEKLHPNHYHTLMSKIEFELGAIAHHCLETYRRLGKNHYSTYRPLEMMFQTDIFFNFVEAHYDVFKEQDGVSLKQAYSLYKEYCGDTGIERPLPQYKVREELRNYFQGFHDRITIDGASYRSYYSGFKAHAWKSPVGENTAVFSLVMDEEFSIFDSDYAHLAAQLAKEDGTPQTRWSIVKTTLADIDTSQLHYVKVPENHIVIDFDLEDDDGHKSLERNLQAASTWPATYAELSKSGAAVHLHYLYAGDVSQLARLYAENIEIKVFTGDASLRRKLSKCNNVPIATINSGLPLKEKKVLKTETIQSERGLRELIARNLRKEIHPGTKPSIDFIAKILDEAYFSGMAYDVTDLRPKILAFANNSSHQPLLCLKTVQKMRWHSDQPVESVKPEEATKETRLTFFDVEVFPNLFVVCWKYQNDPTVVKMINPTPQEIEGLFMMRLVGFNNRRYDNHILYAAFLGYNNEQLFRLSEKIINGSVGSMFGEAYGISYADVYDFSSKKQGLKKWEIELQIHHAELDLPWDQPVPQKRWHDVAEYCSYDVIATEVVFDERRQDFAARQILAELSGLTVNDTTQKHTAKIIFGEDRNPRSSFVYTDLSKEFDGYHFERGISTYRGETVGEGGYVYAEPGMYSQVALLDVASMHPTSISQLNLFGEYTGAFSALVEARLAIKAEDYDAARNLLGGKLQPFLVDAEGNKESTKGLADALKIVVNIVYGLTSAKFDNPFRDIRNVDNIVAKRGALFMIDLKHEVQARGFTVAHIKTDSIKIPNATDEIIDFVKAFGEKYGYTFEYNPEKDFYDKFCLVNDAVYVAKKFVPGNHEYSDDSWKWITVGAQFQHPYVFKTLFSGEEVNFYDFCETKSVTQGAMYLGFDGAETKDKMHFVGRTGQFTPVREGFNGGTLYRVKDDNLYAVTGTKGYLWLESEMAMDLPHEAIDMRYFERLVDEARKTIEKFGSFEEFVG
jgi:hypothetical protein